MSEFNQNEYIKQYKKEKYTNCSIQLKPAEAELLTEYSQNLGISKNKLIKLCVEYCYKNYVDLQELQGK